MNEPTYVDIRDVVKTTILVSKKIGIFVVNLELFVSVSLDVHFYSEDENSVIDVKHLKLEGEDYNNWSNDDSYIVTYVMNKLGLNPKH